MENPPHFLHRKLPDLQKSPEVQTAVDKHQRLEGEKVLNSPDKRLEVYMERLENIFLNEDETTRKRNIGLLRDKIYEAFIIKKEAVPESYFELQKRIARERGQHIEEIDRSTREQMIQVIIEDQKKSLDQWIDYLSSNDAMYPTWFKYFVFRNIVKLSQFDKELGKFKERTKATTSPFPDIYREALAQMADLYESAARDKSLFNDPDFQTFLSKKFPTQYADAVQKTLEHSLEDREQIKGVWVKYEQGNDEEAIKLYESLQGKGTGWCTAGQSTAQAQIDSGDFYVYYTYDKDNNPSQPRLAIRMEENNIGEVRGILPHQNVEPLLEEVLEKKLQDFGSEADRYKKKSSDMKRLTHIEKATEGNVSLTKDDLMFLYEINTKIEGFGYQTDPRIEEIKSKRNRKEDIQTLCNCPPENIAQDFTGITESTQVFCEDTSTKITIFDFREEKNKKKLPQLIELAKKLNETGSSARPDMSFEGGVVTLNPDEALFKDLPTALEAYKKADDGAEPYIWNEWVKAPQSKPKFPLEAIILSYNNDPTIRQSSDKIVADMDKLGVRPATLEEMIALGIAKPEFNKRSSTYLVGLTKYSLDGGSYVPMLDWDVDERYLVGSRWGDEWYDGCRFVCIRKSS